MVYIRLLKIYLSILGYRECIELKHYLQIVFHRIFNAHIYIFFLYFIKILCFFLCRLTTFGIVLLLTHSRCNESQSVFVIFRSIQIFYRNICKKFHQKRSAVINMTRGYRNTVQFLSLNFESFQIQIYFHESIEVHQCPISPKVGKSCDD